MLTLNEQKRLENYICNIIRESLFEFNTENKKRTSYDDDEGSYEHNRDKKHKKNHKAEVLSWLKKKNPDKRTYVINHDWVIDKIWANVDSEESTKRHLFSAKLEDDEYHFDDDDINKMYNLKNNMF